MEFIVFFPGNVSDLDFATRLSIQKFTNTNQIDIKSSPIVWPAHQKQTLLSGIPYITPGHILQAKA